MKINEKDRRMEEKNRTNNEIYKKMKEKAEIKLKARDEEGQPA